MVFAGANVHVYDQMWQALGSGSTDLTVGPTAARIYLDQAAGSFPNTKGYAGVQWPAVSNNGHALVSIRPDISTLLAPAGDFDDDLIAFMRSAPPGPTSLLTIWHEAATFHTSDSSYPQDAALFRQAQLHMKDLASTTGLNVKFGMVNIQGLSQDTYNQWLAPGLDWYGCDIYDNKSCSMDAAAMLDDFQAKMNALGGGTASPAINVPECNSRDNTSFGGNGGPACGSVRRAQYLNSIWNWLESQHMGNSSGMLTFWGGTGGESPASGWAPNDEPVNAALSGIFAASSP